MSSSSTKEINQLKLIEHMERVLKNGLLGKDINYVLNQNPKSVILGGVLFPNSIFKDDNEDETEDEMDPDVRFTSISKNVSMGMEFLVKKDKEFKCELSGSFSIFFRVIPSYDEQMEALSYLKFGSEDFIEDKNNSKKTKSLGLNLLEKYKKYNFVFNDLIIKNKEDDLFLDEISYMRIKEEFFNFINEIKNDIEILKPKREFLNKKGLISIDEIFKSKDEFREFINKINDSEATFPDYNFDINVELLDYLHNTNTKKVVISITNSTIDLVNLELHPLEIYDSKLEVNINSYLHENFVFDGVRSNYKLDNTYKVKGINCTAVAKFTKSDSEIRLVTEFMPRYFQKLYRTRDDIPVEFCDLMDPKKTLKKLNEIVLKMKVYSSEWSVFINNSGDEELKLKSTDEINHCNDLLKEFLEEIESFELGIYVLNQDMRLMKAFNLANKAFKELSGDKFKGWRLFQIVFIVRMLPSLYNREMSKGDSREDAIIKSSSYADVLWFPTGGGKTEAYLGTILTNLFYDRLRGKNRGVTAWIRFPLRMLSKNQLDRMAKLLIIAEKLRLTDKSINGEGVPFSIGFFAGSGNTDNFVKKSTKDSILLNERNKINKMLIHKCPSCNNPLELLFNETQWRFVHKCNNAECFVKQHLNGNIPIYTTDSEVYRFVPSIILGTVDKTAIAGRYREFSQLFGQAQARCEKHGFFSDQCIVGRNDEYGSCNKKASKNDNEIKKIRDQFYDPVPTLFIQDELHLLKDELGSLSSHNEGYLIQLSKTFCKSESHIPKIIAATATIEAYEKHIKHLYLRKPRKYPSMGYKPGESFYATSTPHRDRRLYLGILPHSKSQEEVISRAAYLYQTEIKNMYNNPDRYVSKLGLENINNFNEFLSDFDLSTIYVNNKSMGYEIDARITEFQDIKLVTDILTGENDMEKIVKVIDQIESERNIKSDQKLNILIATSLISHGVDLDRINNLFMAGMPSKIAEYIQASSRSARSNVGLVFISFKSTNLKERSQYQYFVENHKFLDQLVDPVPINRMAIKAVEKSFPSILSSLLLGIHSGINKAVLDKCGKVDKYISEREAKSFSAQNELLEQLFSIYGCDSEFFPLATREKLKEHIKTLFEEKMNFLRTSPNNSNIKDRDVLNPISSFREIEEGIPILVGRDTGIILHYSKHSNKRGH